MGEWWWQVSKHSQRHKVGSTSTCTSGGASHMIPRCSQRRTKRQQDWMCFKTQNTQTHRACRTKKMSRSCFCCFFFWLFCCYLKMSDVPENYQFFPFPFRINEGVRKFRFKNSAALVRVAPWCWSKRSTFSHTHTYIYTHVFIFINAHLHKPSRTGAVVGVHLWTFFFSLLGIVLLFLRIAVPCERHLRRDPVPRASCSREVPLVFKAGGSSRKPWLNALEYSKRTFGRI